MKAEEFEDYCHSAHQYAQNEGSHDFFASFWNVIIQISATTHYLFEYYDKLTSFTHFDMHNSPPLHLTGQNSFFPSLST